VDDVAEQRLGLDRFGHAALQQAAMTSMPASGFFTSWAMAAAISQAWRADRAGAPVPRVAPRASGP